MGADNRTSSVPGLWLDPRESSPLWYYKSQVMLIVYSLHQLILCPWPAPVWVTGRTSCCGLGFQIALPGTQLLLGGPLWPRLLGWSWPLATVLSLFVTPAPWEGSRILQLLIQVPLKQLWNELSLLLNYLATVHRSLCGVLIQRGR